MATLGPNDLKQWALPAGWDAARLENLRLADGETYERLINDISAALAMANGSLMSDPIIGSLITINPDMTVEYRTGVSNGFEDHTEYTQPDAKRAAATGHMLEPVSKDRALGWTWDFLRKARRSQIDNDIASAFQDLKDVWQKTLLHRLFKSTKTTVGAAGFSAPVADGGTADSTYIPYNLPERATAFASSHTHLQRLDGITQANLETCVAHLWEHGFDAPFDLLVAQADLGSWSNATSVTGWVKRADGLIRYGTQTDLAAVDPSYIGVIETSTYGPVRVRASARIPTKYYAVYKSWGAGDARNVLRVAPSPNFGLGAVLLAGDHIRQYPLEYAILFLEFFQGIQDRASAVLCYNHTSASYVIPTIL
jgi:hypothetical protein